MSDPVPDAVAEAMHTFLPLVPLPGLEAERVRQGLTHKAVAEAAGCSESTVRAAEGRRGNRSVSLHTAGCLARALGVSIASLVYAQPTQSFACIRRDMERFLLGYRAVHYVPQRGQTKRKQTQEAT